MSPLLRMLLVAVALLSSGALQVASALGDDPCCPEETGSTGEEDSCPECPPGVACACCPIRGAVHASALDVVPAAASRGVAIPVAAAEPALGASAADIFHPPRA